MDFQFKEEETLLGCKQIKSLQILQLISVLPVEDYHAAHVVQ